MVVGGGGGECRHRSKLCRLYPVIANKHKLPLTPLINPPPSADYTVSSDRKVSSAEFMCQSLSDSFLITLSLISTFRYWFWNWFHALVSCCSCRSMRVWFILIDGHPRDVLPSVPVFVIKCSWVSNPVRSLKILRVFGHFSFYKLFP